MKRFLVFALLLCLVFTSGCISIDPENPDAYTDPSTEPSVQASAESTAEATEPVATTDPIECDPYFCTVYLLEEFILCDSGSTKYYYDENYNITHYDVLTIENEHHYTTKFEEPNELGMPCKVIIQWNDGSFSSSTLAYFMDGKLKEEMEDNSNYTGYQYEYDQKGDLIEKREYFEGILQSTVIYKYSGETLTSVHCETPEGTHIYDCVVEDGRIVQVNYPDDDYPYSFVYTYDKNGNIIRETFGVEGETFPSAEFRYKAVEVTPDRVFCLLQQQKYLINIP